MRKLKGLEYDINSENHKISIYGPIDRLTNLIKAIENQLNPNNIKTLDSQLDYIKAIIEQYNKTIITPSKIQTEITQNQITFKTLHRLVFALDWENLAETNQPEIYLKYFPNNIGLYESYLNSTKENIQTLYNNGFEEIRKAFILSLRKL